MSWPLVTMILIAIPSAARGQEEPPALSPVSGRPLSAEAILPADVLARVELVREELELIRFEMGQPKARPTGLAVTDVSPRETIYQALTLFRNANQLYLEVTGNPAFELSIELPDDPRPFHVWRIVEAARSRLLRVKRELGIGEEVREERQGASTTPSDVFLAIMDVNRQLQLLIRVDISTNDVFQQVALATAYADALLGRFPGSGGARDAPALERGKRPVDVYNVLVHCHARVYTIMEASGLPALKLRASPPEEGVLDPDRIRPSEVYDVAVLLVSELAALHARLESAGPPVPSLERALRLPSHVHQKARLLLLQLAELEKRISANPNWGRRP